MPSSLVDRCQRYARNCCFPLQNKKILFLHPRVFPVDEGSALTSNVSACLPPCLCHFLGVCNRIPFPAHLVFHLYFHSSSLADCALPEFSLHYQRWIYTVAVLNRLKYNELFRGGNPTVMNNEARTNLLAQLVVTVE